jgi:WD40 repeat protein
LLNLQGEILWQRETGPLSQTKTRASQNLLAAGSTQDLQTGILWAFSKRGDVLWVYNHSALIDEVAVAPDSSCIVFTDEKNSVNCVRNGDLIWSEYVDRTSSVGNNRTLIFSPDSSYLVYGSEKSGPRIVAVTPEGEELWSYPLENSLRSAVITQDGQFIIAGSQGYIYKFTREGHLVWKRKAGADNKCIAITPKGNFIAVGSYSLFSQLIVLDIEGTVLWKALSSDSIFSVAISPDGEYVAFSNRSTELYIFSNPPESNAFMEIIV